MSETEDFLLDVPEAAPKRGRKPGATSRKGITNLREQLEGFLTLANIGIFSLAPSKAIYALREDEIHALSEALAEEIIGSPTALKFMTSANNASKHIKLVTVIFSITTSRIMLANAVKKETPNAEPDTSPEQAENIYPLPVGSGAASSDYRGYGDGQNDGRVSYTQP